MHSTKHQEILEQAPQNSGINEICRGAQQIASAVSR
jgi:hypothetical protein